MRAALILALVLGWAAFALPAGAADFQIDDAALVRGEQSFVRLIGADDPAAWTVTFTYRPNSETSRVSPTYPFAADGSYLWTPDFAGIVQINAAGPDGAKVSRNVAVRFPAPPASGIAILLIAGAILFGGAGYSLVRVLRS